MEKIYKKYAKNPTSLAKLNKEELNILARSIRNEIIEFTNEFGGHLGSQLGAVEITLALFRHFDFKKDKVFFDINDQTDTYKLLTNQPLSPEKHLLEFEDSETYNHWTAGHTSTALAGALGAAKARDIKKKKHEVIAVVGDASFWSGLNMEAFSQAPAMDTKIITILNDNNFSMEPIDGFWTQLAATLGTPGAKNIRKDILKSKKFELIGPIDGNNLEELDKAFKYAKSVKSNKHILIWAKTVKGLSNDGEVIEWSHWVSKGHVNDQNSISTDVRKSVISKQEPERIDQFITYYLDKLLANKKYATNLAVFTPSVIVSWYGFWNLMHKYPHNVWNTNINEEFSVTFGAGLGLNGIKPIFLVGSTFSQRAYDQFIHDVARQNQPMLVFLGNTGLDTTISESHQAMFDSAMFKQMPNTEIYEPVNLTEVKDIMDYYCNKVKDKIIVVRLKSTMQNSDIKTKTFAKWEKVLSLPNHKANIVASGSVVKDLKELIVTKGLSWNLYNATAVKPLDSETLEFLAKDNAPLFTVEHEYRLNSLGAQINDYYNLFEHKKVAKIIAMDNNVFNCERTEENVLKFAALDNNSVVKRILSILKNS